MDEKQFWMDVYKIALQQNKTFPKDVADQALKDLKSFEKKD